MTGDLLQDIQQLQFSDRGTAESMLRSFIAETFPLDIQRVELRPQAVSLNSFNGFLTLADDTRLFFKTHTEQDNVIGEYYNAMMLADAGYPVIQPVYSSTQAGQHLLIYEVIDDPSVFDVAWAIEQGENTTDLNALTEAQNAADDHLLELYLATLQDADSDAMATAPIHQLFYHRLVGGRLGRFYGALPGKTETFDPVVQLPGKELSMQVLRSRQWSVNGQEYDDTLDDCISRAIRLLQPQQAGISIVGHGDAHNGNVFFRRDNKSLLYFDPAFAGRHDPLLDLTKPLFHNIFAMWMYFPQEKQQITDIKLRDENGILFVDHDYALPPLRHMFLRSKVKRTLIPIIQEMKRREQLRADWREYLKSALFCCPFLTLNLIDPERYPPEISLLGLSMAVEMGAESYGERSLIDQTLDEVEKAL